MDEAGLRAAIEQPAASAGLVVDAGLVALLLADLGLCSSPGEEASEATASSYEVGRLLLLAYALRQTWERREGRRLTVAAYQATGRIDGAVAKAAEAAYATLDGDGKRAARRLLLRLVTLGKVTADTRRRVLVTEFTGSAEAPATSQVLAELVQARLLTADADASGRRTVEISHEALLTAWPRLRSWLSQDRAGQRTHRELTEAAYAWKDRQLDPGLLFRGTRLATAGEWAADHQQDLNAEELQFLTASQRQQRRAGRLREAAVGTLVVLLIASLAATWVAVHVTRNANNQRDLAVSGQLASQSEALDTTNPVEAAQLAAAAWQAGPTSLARDSLLDVLAQPARGTLAIGRVPVYGVAISPDAKLLATVSDDGTARLWSLATHKQVGATLVIGGHDLHAAVAFSPDGNYLATASTDTSGNDHAVDLWKTATGRRVAILAIAAGNGDEPVELAFSPRGDILAASTSYGAAYLWNVPTMRRIGAPPTDDSAIMSGLAFSPDGKILATAGTDGKVTLWNVATHSRVGAPLTVDTSSGWTTVAFSPGGDILATGTSGANGQNSLWNVATHARMAALNTDCAPDGAAFSPDGGIVAIACTDGNTQLWDMPTQQEVDPPLIASSSQVWAVTFSPDGSILATGNANGTVSLWDVDAFRQLGGSLNARSTLLDVAFSPDGTTLATTGQDGTARLWNAATHQQIGAPLSADTQGLWDVAFSPDGKILATGSYDGTARLWNVASHQQIGAPLSLPGQDVYSVAFSPDGKTLATGSYDGTAHLWNVATHQQIGKPMNTHGAVIHLAFSPDGRILATGNYDGTDQLWNVTTHQPIATLLTNGGILGPLAFSPDGRTIVTANQEGVVQFWDVATRRQIGQPLAADDQAVVGMAFSPDGTTLATASADGTARLWDVETHQEIGSPLAASESIAGMAFSPSGKMLATVSGSEAQLWGVALPHHLLPDVCAIAGYASPMPEQWSAIGQPPENICS